MNTSEVLNMAADLIETRGWTQGGSAVDDPWGELSADAPVCLEGAIMAATGLRRGEFYTCPAHNAVADYLERKPVPTNGPLKESLWEWNDTEGRTDREVVEVLRAAALIEAAREEQDAAWETSA